MKYRRLLRASRRYRAFTLVELLVVVGLIALLIAMLLPALGRAREHANRVKCAANLRSIGQVLTMYTEQFHYYPGMVVYEVNGASVADAAIWPQRLRPYLGGDKQVFYCPSQDERCRWSDRGPLPLTPAQKGSRFVSYGYEP